MVDAAVQPADDALARLQATIDSMRKELDGLRPRTKHKAHRTTWRRRAALLGGIVSVGALVSGLAGASVPGNPADVEFVSLSVPHKVLSNAAIAKGAANSPVVIGGSTTVPSDATSVRMTVSIKSTVAGSMTVFPADHASSTTGDSLSYPGGNVVTSFQTQQSPGLSGKVTFANNGTATATTTVTITGYSTQTTASNISNSGGTPGQVLTNTISGGAWQSLPIPSAANFSGSGGTAGQVLTNDGNGDAVWRDLPGIYSTYANAMSLAPLNTYTTFLTLTLPAGTYLVSSTVFVANNSSTGTYSAFCYLVSPSNSTSHAPSDVWLHPGEGGSMGNQDVIVTTGGNVTLQCSGGSATPNLVQLYNGEMYALPVSGVTGNHMN